MTHKQLIVPKKTAAVLLLSFFLGGGLFADEFGIIDTTLDGDMLNGIINRYVTNISNLTTDSTAMQNIWSYASGGDWLFGLGINAGITLANKNEVGRIGRGGGGFGGSDIDLTQFPEGLPYLPAGSIDIRIGAGRFDFGIAGMFMNSQWLPVLQSLLGEDADYTYGTAGLDLRYAVIDSKGRLFINNIGSRFLPAVSIQGCYYFAYMATAFTSGDSEEVEINFRTDSYALSLQTSKDFEIGGILGLTPYLGLKYIISGTDTAFSWKTGRPVRVNGGEYPDGAAYYSGDKRRDLKSYFQIYGGTGISLKGIAYFVTLGFSYNVVTEHFGINGAVRFIM